MVQRSHKYKLSSITHIMYDFFFRQCVHMRHIKVSDLLECGGLWCDRIMNTMRYIIEQTKQKYRSNIIFPSQTNINITAVVVQYVAIIFETYFLSFIFNICIYIQQKCYQHKKITFTAAT